MSDGNIWFVKHPTSQYKEDVKKIAKAKGLKIIDARFKDGIGKEFVADKAPKLTLKSEANKEPKKEPVEK